MHDKVAVPEFATLLGVSAPHERFVGTVSVKLTVPVKPLIAGRAVTVMVDVPATPAFTVTPVGLALIVKS